MHINKILIFSFIALLSTIGFAQSSKNAKLTDSLNVILNQAFYYSDSNYGDENALKKTLEAENLVREYPHLNSPFFKTLTNLIKARIFISLNNIEEFNIHIDIASKNAKLTNSNILKSSVYLTKASLFFTNKEYDITFDYTLKSIEALDREALEDDKITLVSKDFLKIDIYYNLADLKYRPFLNWRFNKKPLLDEELQNELILAAKYAKKTIHLINKTGKRKGRKKYMLLIIAQGYTENGNFKLSKVYLDSLNQSVRFKDNLNKFRLNDAYGNYYSKIKDEKKAKFFYKEAYRFSRKYTDKQYLRYKNKLNNQIEFLSEGLKGDLLRAEISLKKTERFKNITTFLSILLVIIGLLIYSILQRRYSKMKTKSNLILINKNKQLNKTIDDKVKLENKIRNIQEVIARDLHDNFGNRIAGINTVCTILKDLQNSKEEKTEDYKKFLDHLNNGVTHLNSDIKDLIWANNIKNNLFSEVVIRLEEFTNELKKGITCSCSIRFEKEVDKDYILPSFWNRQMLLIFKEAINNACKYATSAKVLIQIEAKHGNIKITCKDLGPGFNLDSVERRSGLFNMPKRAESIDCKLTINSSIENGTEIVFYGTLNKD